MMAKRRNPAMKIAQKSAHNAMFDAQGKPKPGVHNVLLRAVEVQRPLVLANLRRLQRRHPQATAAQLAATLERDYLLAVTGGGALVGGAAVIPGVGTAAALGLSAAATVGFLEATALFSTSLAELHGVRLVDPEKASTLVMAIMLGEEGTALLSSLSGQAAGQGKGPTQAWGSLFSRRVPLAGFGTVRERIQTMFLRTLLKQQGTAWLGRALPFGIGAVVGGVGNRVMGRAVVANAKEAFGPMPLVIPGELGGPPQPRPGTPDSPGRQQGHEGQLCAERRHVLDLNADLGESFGTWTMGDDAAMLPLVTSASVACGLHAGDPVTMLDTCRAAYELDVRVGAHLGYPDLAGFGLRAMDITFDDLFGAVLYQLGALDGVAHAVGASVDYVKLHGALYDRTVRDAEQASAVVAAIQAYDPGLPVLGFPGSALLGDRPGRRTPGLLRGLRRPRLPARRHARAALAGRCPAARRRPDRRTGPPPRHQGRSRGRRRHCAPDRTAFSVHPRR